MTVIYFTDGALIDDVGIRRSLVRIPEVIEALRKASNQFIQTDLFLIMNEESSYKALNFFQKKYLKNLIQESLFNRWMKLGQQVDLILKRSDYFYQSDLIELFVKLSTVDKIKVITVGPGFDDLELLLKLNGQVSLLPFCEIISIDSKLNWFWHDVKTSLELHS